MFDVNLTPLGRFVQPTVRLQPFENEWEFAGTPSNPWKPSTIKDDWRNIEHLPVVKYVNFSDCVYLIDSQNNRFAIKSLDGVNTNANLVYYANIVSYSENGNTIQCVDFPDFSGEIYAPTSVVFDGNGTTEGITGLTLTYETVGVYCANESLFPKHYPHIETNSFLTCRNGYFKRKSANEIACLWDYHSDYDPTIHSALLNVTLQVTKPIITGIGGYFQNTYVNGILTRRFYGAVCYNNHQEINTIPTSNHFFGGTAWLYNTWYY